MSGSVIGKTMNLGWIGRVSRDADVIIINRVASEDTNFGAPVFLKGDNQIRNYATATDETDAAFLGFAVAEVKQATSYNSNEVKYATKSPVDVITRGTIVVQLGTTTETPLAGGKVYLVAATGKITSVATSNIELTNCKFTTGIKDANGCLEITLATKNLV